MCLTARHHSESSAIVVAKYLMDEGAHIHIYDPKVKVCSSVAECTVFVGAWMLGTGGANDGGSDPP